MEYLIRPILKGDLEAVLDCERAFNALGDGTLNPWSLGADELLAVLARREDAEAGTYLTKTLVVEDSDDLVHGAFTYELHPSAFALTWLVVHPDGDAAAVLARVRDFLLARAANSRTRKSVHVYLRDRDEAGLRTFFSFWSDSGFEAALLRDYYGDHDGWLMSLDLQ